MLTQILTHLYWENNLNNNLQKQYAVLDSETPAALKRSERCRRWQKSSDSGECLLFCVSFLSPLWWVDISFIPSCLLHLCPFCLLSCFFHLLPRLPVIRINLVMVSVLSITQMAMVRILKLDALFFTSTNSVSLFKCYSVQSILPKCVTIQSLKMHKMPEKGNNWSYAKCILRCECHSNMTIGDITLQWYLPKASEKRNKESKYFLAAKCVLWFKQ